MWSYYHLPSTFSFSCSSNITFIYCFLTRLLQHSVVASTRLSLALQSPTFSLQRWLMPMSQWPCTEDVGCHAPGSSSFHQMLSFHVPSQVAMSAWFSINEPLNLYSTMALLLFYLPWWSTWNREYCLIFSQYQVEFLHAFEAMCPKCFRQAGVFNRIPPHCERNVERGIRWGRELISWFPDWWNTPGTKATCDLECCLQAHWGLRPQWDKKEQQALKILPVLKRTEDWSWACRVSWYSERLLKVPFIHLVNVLVEDAANQHNTNQGYFNF